MELQHRRPPRRSCRGACLRSVMPAPSVFPGRIPRARAGQEPAERPRNSSCVRTSRSARDLDPRRHVEVPPPSAGEPRHTPPANPEAPARSACRVGPPGPRAPHGRATATRGPSTASATLTGTSRYRLSPLRVKTGSSCTRVMTIRSPRGPPKGPAVPLSRDADLRARVHAGGNRHPHDRAGGPSPHGRGRRGRARSPARPRPSHAGQLGRRARTPSPLQTAPTPPQCAHVTRAPAGPGPLAPHVSHGDSRSTVQIRGEPVHRLVECQLHRHVQIVPAPPDGRRAGAVASARRAAPPLPVVERPRRGIAEDAIRLAISSKTTSGPPGPRGSRRANIAAPAAGTPGGSASAEAAVADTQDRVVVSRHRVVSARAAPGVRPAAGRSATSSRRDP